MHRSLPLFSLALLTLVSACAPSARIARAPEPVPELPAVPAQDGPLAIELAYPRPGARKPNADSTFVFGTVGTGEARLTINGERVPLAPNGAFLAYVPVPRDGTYAFAARADGRTETFSFSYATAPPSPGVEAFDAPRRATVVGGRDTLATGSQIAHAAPTPGGDRRWFFPPGTRLVATGRAGDHVRLQLTSRTEAWIAASAVELGDPTDRSGAAVGSVAVVPHGRYVDVEIGASRVPFLVIPGTDDVEVVLYGLRAPGGAVDVPGGGFVERAAWRGVSADSASLHLELGAPLWGFKAFHRDDGRLVVRLRQPPEVAAAVPLRGLRVMVDPGHPPGGAIGPTGLTEAEANLRVSLRLADMLRERGAEVVLTRTSAEPVASESSVATELWARVDLAVEEDVDLLVSVHNNAFPDGVNPFEHYGTETYYYHPFSAPLAVALQETLHETTGLPDLGAKQRSLALIRPSWMPSALTESLFMMFPQQEAALRDPGFLDRLARAHLDGIVRFLESYLPE